MGDITKLMHVMSRKKISREVELDNLPECTIEIHEQ